MVHFQDEVPIRESQETGGTGVPVFISSWCLLACLGVVGLSMAEKSPAVCYVTKPTHQKLREPWGPGYLLDKALSCEPIRWRIKGAIQSPRKAVPPWRTQLMRDSGGKRCDWEYKGHCVHQICMAIFAIYLGWRLTSTEWKINDWIYALIMNEDCCFSHIPRTSLSEPDDWRQPYTPETTEVFQAGSLHCIPYHTKSSWGNHIVVYLVPLLSLHLLATLLPSCTAPAWHGIPPESRDLRI